MLLIGCETDPDYRIECATLDRGEVEIINRSKHDLLVDVTYSYQDENDPIWLTAPNPNLTVATIFQDIPRGEAKVWYSPDGDNWKWKTVQVTTCERTNCIINIEDL